MQLTGGQNFKKRAILSYDFENICSVLNTCSIEDYERNLGYAARFKIIVGYLEFTKCFLPDSYICVFSYVVSCVILLSTMGRKNRAKTGLRKPDVNNPTAKDGLVHQSKQSGQRLKLSPQKRNEVNQLVEKLLKGKFLFSHFQIHYCY